MEGVIGSFVLMGNDEASACGKQRMVKSKIKRPLSFIGAKVIVQDEFLV
jgi:hypothetical protein